MFKINREVKTKAEEVEKIIFRDDDITKIFDGLDSKNNNFKILIYLLFYTGLRETDLLSITVDKIDLENRELNYFMKKGKKHRRIPFHEDLVPILDSRIKEVKEDPIL
jgi:integrase